MAAVTLGATSSTLPAYALRIQPSPRPSPMPLQPPGLHLWVFLSVSPPSRSCRALVLPAPGPLHRLCLLPRAHSFFPGQTLTPTPGLVLPCPLPRQAPSAPEALLNLTQESSVHCQLPGSHPGLELQSVGPHVFEECLLVGLGQGRHTADLQQALTP